MNNNDKKYLAFIAAVAFGVIAIWFSGKEVIAGGEDGLWLYNPSRSLELYSYGWVEFDTGRAIPAFIPKVPILMFAKLLSLVLAPYLVQALIFFLLISSGMSAMYFVAKKMFSESPQWIWFLIAMFYFFNVFTLTQVWNRNIYSGIFAWSYLPVHFYFSVEWLKTANKKFLFLSCVSSIIFSSAFATLAFLFTIWIPVFLYFFFLEKKRILRIISLLAIWGLTNLWWAVPFFDIGVNSFGKISELRESSINSLIGVSQYFPSRELLFLRQSYFFSTNDGRDRFWSAFYNSYFSHSIQVLIFLLVLFGIIYVSKKKIKIGKYVVVLFLLGWFLSKGSNPPLGYEFYELLFSKFGFTLMFRNPFEKLGLVFLFPYSLLLGLGIYYVYKKLKFLKRLALLASVFLIYGILVWPIWTGDLYTDSVKLSVPGYYSEANNFIEKVSRSNGERILVLPLRLGDSSFHSWDYMGAVPTAYLFSKSVADHPLAGSPYFEDLLMHIEKKSSPELLNLFKKINVGYVVFDESVELIPGRTQIVSGLLDYIGSDPNFIFLNKFGDIHVYKVRDVFDQLFEVVNTEAVKVDYVKISPVEYRVEINGALVPYQLLFRTTFDKKWTATIDDEEIEEHYVALDYANSWDVNKEGSYTIKIFFKRL